MKQQVTFCGVMIALALIWTGCEESTLVHSRSDARPLDAAPTDSGLAPADTSTNGNDEGSPPPVPDAAPPDPATVDPTTLAGKVMFGYQGWFACPGDGSALNGWLHWFNGQTPSADSATVDFWPDVSELSPGERCATQMTLPDGQVAEVFSSFRPATVERHFSWMQDQGLDGVFLQRFVSELSSPNHLAFRDQVAKNVMAGAEKHGRVFAMMYDIAGTSSADVVDRIKNDWGHLVTDLKLTQSTRYLHHAGKPVLAIWGLGFTHTSASASQAAGLVAYLKGQAPADQQVTLMGGVPTHWRTLQNDARADPAWADVYRSMDVLSPWTVGRYSTEAGADAHKSSFIVPDMAALQGSGVSYLPVLFPGFSWANLKPGAASNQIPRNGGAFFWRQAYNAISAGAEMLYIAMFDEVDEGTAMFKLAPTAAELPAQGTFVALDADGYNLPADWYLRLAAEATRALRKQIPLSPSMPITPP